MELLPFKNLCSWLILRRVLQLLGIREIINKSPEEKKQKRKRSKGLQKDLRTELCTGSLNFCLLEASSVHQVPWRNVGVSCC